MKYLGYLKFSTSTVYKCQKKPQRNKWEYIAKGENTQVILANPGSHMCDELEEGLTEKLRLRVSS